MINKETKAIRNLIMTSKEVHHIFGNMNNKTRNKRNHGKHVINTC